MQNYTPSQERYDVQVEWFRNSGGKEGVQILDETVEAVLARFEN